MQIMQDIIREEGFGGFMKGSVPKARRLFVLLSQPSWAGSSSERTNHNYGAGEVNKQEQRTKMSILRSHVEKKIERTRNIFYSAEINIVQCCARSVQ